jgi:hypothetical protein
MGDKHEVSDDDLARLGQLCDDYDFDAREDEWSEVATEVSVDEVCVPLSLSREEFDLLQQQADRARLSPAALFRRWLREHASA